MSRLKRDWEAVVVGAGPAGSTAARVLAESGREVVLVERSRPGREKLCAGAVSGRAAALLPAGRLPAELVREPLRGVSLGWSTRRVRAWSEQPFAWTVDRAEFDRWLMDAAIEAGATLVADCHVDAVEADGTGAVVYCAGETMRADVVVRCDGAAGFSRLFGRNPGFGLEVVVPRDQLSISLEAGEALADVGAPRGGYSWVIPRGERVSVGVGASFRVLPGLRTVMNQWLARTTREGTETARVAGHPIPGAVRIRRCARGRVLLAGDAAGLADPLTGEGIHSALWSGMAAARALHLYLAGREPTDIYDRWLRQDLWPELARSRTVAMTAYALPAVMRWLFCSQPGVARALIAAIGGTGSSRDVWASLI